MIVQRFMPCHASLRLEQVPITRRDTIHRRNIVAAIAISALVLCPWNVLASEASPSGAGAQTQTVSPDASVDATDHRSGEQHPAGSPSIEESSKDWAMLLDPMMEPQASKVLVAELVRMIRQNDTKGAERLLSEAISEGTLASLVIDQLHNPGL